MRDSETYNRSATIGTAENRNRKTVVRIQSTKKSMVIFELPSDYENNYTTTILSKISK